MVTVEVFDASWNPLDQLDSPDNVLLVHKAYEPGNGSLDCPATAHNRSLLVRGNRVMVRDETGVVQAGRLRLTGEESGQSARCKPAWDDVLGMMASEPVFPNPGTLTGQGPLEFDSRSGFTSTAVLGLVDANVGPNARPERRIAGLQVGADPFAGAVLSAPVQARWAPMLLDHIAGIARPNGLAFSVGVFGRSLVFNARQVVDRSAEVVLTAADLSSQSWSWSKPDATAVLMLGPGEGSLRLTSLVESDESRAQAARWGGRWVATKDFTGITVVPALKAAQDAAEAAVDAAADALKDAQGDADDAYKDYLEAVADGGGAAEAALSVAANDAVIAAAAAVTTAQLALDAAALAQLAGNEAATYESMRAEGLRALDDLGETLALNCTVNASWFSPSWLYDLVAVELPGLGRVVKPVREVQQSWSSANGYRVVPVIGDYTATSGTRADRATKELVRTVQGLITRA